MSNSKYTPEQQDAIDAYGKNVVVSASAGTGKTHVLSGKVNDLFKNKKINPENILVLTFTNSAASNMKIRIKKNLMKDPNIDRSLIDKINSAHIQTFDSFSLFVFKQFSYLENLDSNISIINDLDLKIVTDKIIDNLLNEELLKNNNSDFKNIYLNYCFKDEEKIKSLIKMMHNFVNQSVEKENILNNPKSFFKDINAAELLYRKLFKKVKSDFKDMYYKYFVMQPFETTAYSDKVLECIEGEGISNLEDYINNITKKFPKANNLYDGDKDIKDNFLNEKKAYLKKFAGANISFDFYKNNEDEIKKYITIMLQITKKLDEKLLNYKRMINCFTFNDIALISLKILDNKVAQKYFRNKFDYILIDEYQDTSDIQETFISKISKNNVFMVGDVKQSIYRFRNANCDIINNKFNLYKDDTSKGTSLGLSINFRARREIISAINDIFSVLMNNADKIVYKLTHEIEFGQVLYDPYKNGNCLYGLKLNIYNNDIVKLLIDSGFITNKKEAEAFFIAQDIINKVNSGYKVVDLDAKIHRQIRFSDFAILCRRKSTFSYIERVFNKFGIPLNNTSKDMMSKFSVVLLLKSIFSFIYNLDKLNDADYDKKIKLNFISIARSFIYSISDEEIYDMLSKDSYKESQIYKNIEELHSFSKKNKLYDLFLKILEKFNIIENIYKIKNIISNIDKLENFSILSKQFDETGKNLEDLIEVFDYMDDEKGDIEIEKISDDDAVNLMTVHASKGLEFSVVYLSDNNFRVKSKKGAEKALIYSKDFNFMFKKNPLIMDNFFYPYSKIFDFEEEIEENIRLYYVALTRIREEGIIFINESEKIASEGNFNSFINKTIDKYNNFHLKNMFFDKNNNFNFEKKKLDVNTNTNTNENKSNTKVVFEEFSETFTPYVKTKASKEIKSVLNEEEIENIDFGNKLHEYLEAVDFKSKDTSFISDTHVKNIIDSLLNSDVFKKIKNDDLIYKEYEFYDDENDIKGFIDLLVIEKENIKIFDYKLKNISDIEYSRQLKIYKDYITRTFKKPCKTYLISILEKKVEEIN